MTAPKFGPWIAHNAKPDGTCPPEAAGKRGQVQLANQTRIAAELTPVGTLEPWSWGLDGAGTIINYRILLEPVRGGLVLTGDNRCGWTFGPVPLASDTHRLSFITSDGTLIPGEYTGPTGAVITVEVL